MTQASTCIFINSVFFSELYIELCYDLLQCWTDGRLKWRIGGNTAYGGVEEVHFQAQDVWLPDVQLRNV